MTNLFSAANLSSNKPLAEAMRPTKLDEIVGQSHLLSDSAPLRRRIRSGRIGSIILYGPPGVGKTTIARAIGRELGKEFVQLHSAETGVADIKKLAAMAGDRETLVFIDEIHRFNAAQQDRLLSHTEQGLFDLLTATTENPFFSLNKALISRSTIYELKAIDQDDISHLVDRAVEYFLEEGVRATFDANARSLIVSKAGGDARRALNTMETLLQGREPGEVTITRDEVEAVLAASPVTYDRSGDAHYDVISAFVKSMRGADEDATLYWLAALIHGGEDPRYIARRIMIHASEDVGLADNTALQTAVAALHAVEKIGYPEARIILAHAALHVCRAPKSNSAYRGISLALDYIKNNGIQPVPNHLRETHYSGAQKLGRGGYETPHSSAEGWNDQSHCTIEPGMFYQSDARSSPTFEQRADQFWDRIRQTKTRKTFQGDVSR